MPDLGEVAALGAQRTPDRIAIIERTGRSISYRDLNERGSRLANALIAMGLRPGDRVACWLEDSIEYVETYVALAKAALVLVALNTRMAPPEAAYQLEQSEAKGLLYSEGMCEKVAELPNSTSLISLAVASEERKLPLGKHYESALRSAATTDLPPVDPESVAMIGYTSGTTGRPKGAMITHAGLAAVARTQHIAMRVPIGGVNMHAVSMSFPATVMCHIIPTMIAGGTSVLVADSWNTDKILDLIHKHRATFIYVPGPSLKEFTALAEARPERWQSLTGVLHAGSRADPIDLERLASVVGHRYIEGWGMTENSGGVLTATSPQDVLDPKRPSNFFSTSGLPVPGAQIKVIDEAGKEMPRGVENVGELKVHSDSIFKGYYNNPEATAEVLDAEGWYKSGDIGSIDETGRVYIAERRTNMIASGGMNVYPAEIELVLARHPDVAEVAVGAGAHERWGQTPVAVVVRKAGTSVDEKSIIDFAKANLASYKKPTRVVFVDEVPRTVGGKISRPDLAAYFQAEEHKESK